MHIEPFGVEIWMNAWETRCDWNLAETCVDSLTIEELLAVAGRDAGDLAALLPLRMSYGEISGSGPLRTAIASLYDTVSPEQILVAHGTIGANMLVHKTLVSAADHVVCITPTYQQHYAIPESLGATVETLQLQESNQWLPDTEALRAMVRPDTRLIALTNPNNPTGALILREIMDDVIAIAREVGAWILCDEVYRGTEQPDATPCPSIADLYERGISTASVSKAFSLAGLRLGWIAAPTELLEAISIHRDYDTISVGMLDDHFATMALQNSSAILARSREITSRNLATLSDWMRNQNALTWVRPQAGTTALLRYDGATPSEALCVDLLQTTGVMLTPGSALNMEGHVRIGYANRHSVLKEGLTRMTGFFKR